MRGRLDATGERGGVRAPSRKIFAKKKSADSCCCAAVLLLLPSCLADGQQAAAAVRGRRLPISPLGYKLQQKKPLLGGH